MTFFIKQGDDSNQLWLFPEFDVDQIELLLNELKASSDSGEMMIASFNANSDVNSLAKIRSVYDVSTIYNNMKNADRICATSVLPQRLALWRAALWGRGMKIDHPHKETAALYNKFVDDFGLNLSINKCMQHLSIMNNACLIWKEVKYGGIEYVQFYNPAMTRIDIVGNKLWVEPSKEFQDAILSASPKEIEQYLQRFKDVDSAKKWVDAIRAGDMNAKYQGKVPLSNDDNEYWMILRGDGVSAQDSYANVDMLSIFSDIDLLHLLYDGDWATAFLLKNIIMVVKLGESINSGPFAGSRRNWAKAADLENAKAQLEKAGKAQIVYGNHTLDIEYKFPDPAVFSSSKYEAVVDRICWFFGIGKYMTTGQGGASYASSVWNVQSIRTEARQKREIVAKSLAKFFCHPVVLKTVFKGKYQLYCHDVVKKIENNIIYLVNTIKNLSQRNFTTAEYSGDNFSTVKEIEIDDVLPDINAIRVRNLPKDAEPNQIRLVCTPKQLISLYGAPSITFDERMLKEDRQTLQELQMLIQQGPLSNITLLRELGFMPEQEIANKAIERANVEDYIPIFERNQGLLQGIFGVSNQNRGGEGSPGRPLEAEERGRIEYPSK